MTSSLEPIELSDRYTADEQSRFAEFVRLARRFYTASEDVFCAAWAWFTGSSPTPAAPAVEAPQRGYCERCERTRGDVSWGNDDARFLCKGCRNGTVYRCHACGEWRSTRGASHETSAVHMRAVARGATKETP